ncbi:MAG: TonB-dependent receptor [Gammaproteobacteria bacterium]|nr:TonB-dependent receptor [Gammaproteobacteria bacterium]
MRNIISCMTGIGLLVMTAPGVKAQSNTADQLGTISVTANREEEKTLEIPASIGVVNESTIELDKPNYQKELFNSIAGVRITQTGSTLGHMTSIRMPLNTGPYYLFLQDGIPVQSSGFFNHNGLAYTNFTSAGSAEILKGAGTALYGSDAIAATINVISKDPSLAEGYKVKVDTGSDGFLKLGLAGGHQYAEDASTGFEFSRSESDGWRDHTSSERNEGNLTHFVALDEDNSLKTIFLANSTSAEMAGSLIGLDELEENPDSVGDIQAAIDLGLDIRRKFDFARISTEWTQYLTDKTELSTIGYVRTNRNRYIATWERNLPQNDSREETVGLMFKANIDQDATLWMLGADLEITRSNRTYEQLFDYVPSGFGSSVPTGDIYDYDVDYQAIAPYIRVEHDISDKVQLGAGLRYDASEFDYTNNLADGQYADSGYSRPDSDNDPSFQHLSPKLNLTYHIDARQNAYVRYANGFRIPQATRLYSLKTNNVHFELDPEITDTLEFGYKLLAQKHQFDASLYYMVIDDTIVRRENADGDRFYVNGGETTHRGIELSWLNNITDQFSTRVAYSYSIHEFVDDDEYGNNEQASAPNDIANLRLIYEPESVQGLVTVFEIEHTGEYWLDDGNTTSYDGYTIAHLKANYRVGKQLKLHAKINNITDKIYAENASLSYGKEKYTPGAPRQVFAGLEYSFD